MLNIGCAKGKLDTQQRNPNRLMGNAVNNNAQKWPGNLSGRLLSEALLLYCINSEHIQRAKRARPSLGYLQRSALIKQRKAVQIFWKSIA